MKSHIKFIIGSFLLLQTTHALSSGYPVFDLSLLMEANESTLQQGLIQSNTYNQYLTMMNIQKLTEGTTTKKLTKLIENNFNIDKKLLENFSFLNPANQYKDMFNDKSISDASFKTFDSAKKTLIKGLFTESKKTDDTIAIRKIREKAYVNSLINAKAISTAHQMKISSFKDDIEKLQKSVTDADGLLPASLAQCAILLKLYEASVSSLAISSSNLELKATEALNRDFKSTSAFPENEQNLNIKNEP